VPGTAWPGTAQGNVRLAHGHCAHVAEACPTRGAATQSVRNVVDGKVGEVPGLVLHDKKRIRTTPRHEKEDELPWSDGSPKRVGGHRHGDVERWHRWTHNRADWSSSYAWSMVAVVEKNGGAWR
jgi:hypothetical protein